MCRAPPLLPFFSFPSSFKFPFPSRTHDFLFLFFPRLIIYSTQNLLETTKPNPTQPNTTHANSSLSSSPSLARSLACSHAHRLRSSIISEPPGFQLSTASDRVPTFNAARWTVVYSSLVRFGEKIIKIPLHYPTYRYNDSVLVYLYLILC